MIMILLHYPGIGLQELMELAPQTADMLLAGLEWAGRIKTEIGETT